MSPLTKGVLSAGALAVLAFGVSVGFQNCAGYRTSHVSASEKSSYLQQNHIFAQDAFAGPSAKAEALEFGSQATTVPGEATGTINQPTEPVPTAKFPLKLMCSDMGSQNKKPSWGGAAALAQSLRFRLLSVDPAGTMFTGCDFTIPNSADLKDTMMNKKELPLALFYQNCQATPAGKYFLLINDPAAPANLPTTIYARNRSATMAYEMAMKNSKPGEDLQIVRSAEGWASNERAQFILADRNPNSNKDTQPFAYLTDPKQCDQEASPLMVKLSGLVGKDNIGLRLTDRIAGVLFDVLGETVLPAFTPMRVSWVTDDKFAFVVLPDANGQVKGVNQLFGDRTRGPDGDFALNGYEALRKWDGRSLSGTVAQGGLPDGVIDGNDPVFEKLRFWIDHNRDGVADANELFPLDQFKIKMLDLEYDPRYLERDRFGNQIRYKSVAQTHDGRLLTMFDLWFAYDGDNNQN